MSQVLLLHSAVSLPPLLSPGSHLCADQCFTLIQQGQGVAGDNMQDFQGMLWAPAQDFRPRGPG